MSSMVPTGFGMSFFGSHSTMPFNANDNNAILPQAPFAPSYKPLDDSFIDPQPQLAGYNSTLSSSQFQADMNDAGMGYINRCGHEVRLSPSALRVDQQASRDYVALGARLFSKARPSSYTPVASSSSFAVAALSSSSAPAPSTFSYPPYDSGFFMSNMNDVFSTPSTASQVDLNATESDDMDLSWILHDDVMGSTMF